MTTPAVPQTPPAKRVRTDELYQLAGDILTTATEGGSNYWAGFRDVTRDPDPARSPLTPFSVSVCDVEDPERAERIVDQDQIIDALEQIAAGATDVANMFIAAAHLGLIGKVDGGEFDSIAADVVLQVAYLGEVVYG